MDSRSAPTNTSQDKSLSVVRSHTNTHLISTFCESKQASEPTGASPLVRRPDKPGQRAQVSRVAACGRGPSLKPPSPTTTTGTVTTAAAACKPVLLCERLASQLQCNAARDKGCHRGEELCCCCSFLQLWG